MLATTHWGEELVVQITVNEKFRLDKKRELKILIIKCNKK